MSVSAFGGYLAATASPRAPLLSTTFCSISMTTDSFLLLECFHYNTGQAQAYAPPWTFNPPESVRVLKQTQIYDVPTAKEQLIDVIKTTDCDGFTAEIVEEYDDYVRATYTSPTFGFIDDVEFWFTRDDRSTVEYSSRSRMGREDGGKNRNRIRTLRKALTSKYDWASVGF